MFAQELTHLPTAKGAAVVTYERLLDKELQRVITGHVERRDQHERLALNQLGMELLGQRKWRTDHDRQIDLAGIDLRQQIQRDTGNQLWRDTRRLFQQTEQHPRQQAGLYRTNGTDSQFAPVVFERLRSTHQAERLEDLLGQRQRPQASRIKIRRAARSIEQAQAQRLLKIFDLGADR